MFTIPVVITTAFAEGAKATTPMAAADE